MTTFPVPSSKLKCYFHIKNAIAFKEDGLYYVGREGVQPACEQKRDKEWSIYRSGILKLWKGKKNILKVLLWNFPVRQHSWWKRLKAAPTLICLNSCRYLNLSFYSVHGLSNNESGNYQRNKPCLNAVKCSVITHQRYHLAAGSAPCGHTCRTCAHTPNQIHKDLSLHIVWDTLSSKKTSSTLFLASSYYCFFSLCSYITTFLFFQVTIAVPFNQKCGDQWVWS